jgi:hypothetical protein
MTKYGLALDEGRRALDEQREHIGSIRNRAGTLLGFGIVAYSVLGGLATRDCAPVGRSTWIALLAFAGTVLTGLAVSWPRNLWSGHDPKVVVGWVDEEGWTESLAEKGMAKRMSVQFAANEKKARWLTWLYMVSVVSLLIEIIALIWDLRSH